MSLDASDPELQAAFPKAYGQLRQPRHETGVGDLVRAYLENRRDSLSDILHRGEPIPADRLNQIRLLLRRLLLNDSFIDPQVAEFRSAILPGMPIFGPRSA